MREKVMDIHSIEPELQTFERVFGCRLCLHPFSDMFYRGGARLFAPIRQSHRRTHPERCGKEARSYCIAHCMRELNRRIAARPSRDLFTVHCRNRCFELASPVFRNGRCVLVMFAGLLDPRDREKVRTVAKMLPVFASGIETKVYAMSAGNDLGRESLETRVEDYIGTHCSERISTATAARALCVSVSLLCHTLRASGGGSFSQRLMAERIRRAGQMLDFADPDFRLADIAQLCGFGSYEHFSRCFRRVTGVSPAAWRRGHDPA